MAKLFNRVKMTVSGTPGAGTVTLGAAVSNFFLTFAEAGVANGNVVSYLIEDGTDFEIGIGTYTTAGTTLSRDTVAISKIGGTSGTTKLTLTSAAVVYITARKEDLLSASETQTANQLFGGPTSGGAAVPAFRALVGADLPAGTILQVLSTTYTAATALATIPYDDTIPLSSEGTQYLSLAITPASSSNKIWCIVHAWGSVDLTFAFEALSVLFRGTTVINVGYTSNFGSMSISHLDSPATTSSTTYSVRGGSDTGSNLFINGDNGGRKFGGAAAATLVLIEVKG